MSETRRIKEVQRVPFSSIVGQSMSLHDETGAHICQLPIVGLMTTSPESRTQRTWGHGPPPGRHGAGPGAHRHRRRGAAAPRRRRAQPTSWCTAAATGIALMGSIGMLATFTWWFTAVSPAVLTLDRRVTKIDDPEIGRMMRAEQRLEQIEAWRTTVVRR